MAIPNSIPTLWVSDPQLQPGGAQAESTEEHSATRGPAEEIIRPRPQGSSPVYEYPAEGAGFGVQAGAPGRRRSGRRRSWWKRLSGDSQDSSVSHAQAMQETAEVTLKTEVEAGASGYSVTGGGAQGIFVKQVLKDSSAAKLFSLRAGDQLLSATIFFDDIKYEDALKILQYSEPYKVQFNLRRKLPAREEEECAVHDPQLGWKGQQDKEAPDGCTETPTKTLEADGDRERLIAKPSGGRGRRSQDRLSWPKFQAIRSRGTPGPRRSHSSSEAYERRDSRNLSPSSTDTEALGGTPAGGRRKRFPLHLRLRRSSAQGRAGRPAPGQGHTGAQQQLEPGDGDPQDAESAAGGRRESRTQAREATNLPLESSLVGGEEEPWIWEGRAAGRQPETPQGKTQEEAETRGELGARTALGRRREDGPEMRVSRRSLQDDTEEVDVRGQPPETQVRIRPLQTPKFGFSKEKGPQTERGSSAHEERRAEQRSCGEGATLPKGSEGWWPAGLHADQPGQEEGTTHGEPETRGPGDMEEAANGKYQSPGRTKMPRFKMPSFSWSPTKQAGAGYHKQIQEKERQPGERHEGEQVTMKLDIKDKEADAEDGGKLKPDRIQRQRKQTVTTTEENDLCNTREGNRMTMGVNMQVAGAKLEGDLTPGDKDMTAKDSKLKMPKFKMPSFGGSGPDRPLEGVLQESTPKVQGDVDLSPAHRDLKTPEVSAQLPSDKEQARLDQMAMRLPEGQILKGELVGHPTGAGLKGHLPKVQMPSLRMPKVDFKGPKVEIKAPSLEAKGLKAEADTPDLEMSLPSMEVDIQTPIATLEGDLALRDKDMSTKDSKFKMPKFKMPSFGLSAPSKSSGAEIEVSTPKQGKGLPSVHGDLKTPEVSVQLPSAEMEAKLDQVDMKISESQLSKGELEGHSTGAELKGHLLSLKIPKVDLKGPQVDIKGPKLDVKGHMAEPGTSDLGVAVPSVEVDIMASGAKLEGDLTLRDKDMSAKDSKLKMPKFKMPSFSVSVPSKPSGGALELSTPKVKGEGLPSIRGDLKSHLPKVHMPSLKMPKVDFKGPKAEADTTDLEVALPSMEMDSQTPCAKLEGDLALEDKDMSTKDSKLKMPKFKMPSFGLSASSKPSEGAVQVSVPKVQGDVDLPSVHGDLKTPEVSIQLSSAEIEAKLDPLSVTLPEGQLPEGDLPSGGALELSTPKVKGEGLPSIRGDLKTPEVSAQLPSAEIEAKLDQVALKLPEDQLPEGDLEGEPTGAGLSIHLPKVQMPSLKMPKVALKGPQVDIKGPKAEAGTADLEVALPNVEVAIQTPSAKLEGDLALKDQDVSTKDSKFKMPKFKMPSFGVSLTSKPSEGEVEVSVPKVQGDVDLPSVHGDLTTPEISVQLSSAEIEAELDQVAIELPEGQLPEGQLLGHIDRADLKGHLPKVHVPSLKMPKVDFKAPQVDIKGPRLDVKGPKAEADTPDLEVALPSVEVDIQTPSAKLEGDLALKDQDVSTKDSKFKMPKFKMPSFGVSMPSKPSEVTVEVSVPKVQGDVDLPSVHGDLKTPEVSIQQDQVPVQLSEGQILEGELMDQPARADFKGHLPKVLMPSLKVDFKAPQVDIKGPKMDMKGPKAEADTPDLEVALPSMEVDIQTPSAKLEGDLVLQDKDMSTKDSKLKVHMPSLKMPKVDFKGPKAEAGTPDLEVALPSMEMDIQTPSAKLEGDLALRDMDMSTKDSKLKMPKFKMPSFGLSAPSKPSRAAVEVSVPKVQGDVGLPSVHGDLKTPEVSVQLSSAEIEAKLDQVTVKLPEVQLPKEELVGQSTGADLKGQLPKVQMPSLKMPKVDLKGPQVDMKGSKAEAGTADLEVALPSVEVAFQTPSAKLEGDLALKDQDVSTKDSKFKMPKFKMPSFGVSLTSKPSEGEVEVSVPKVQGDVDLPSVHGDLKTPEVSIQLPSAEIEAKLDQVAVTLPEGQLPEVELAGQPPGAGLSGHLPTMQMPSLKMPKVALKGPQVDIKGPKAEAGTTPDLQVDMQAPGIKLDRELSMEDKDMAAKDSKLKMTKFKMPSFGVSVPSKPSEGEVEVSVPKVQGDVDLPSVHGDLTTPEISVQLSSAEIEAELDQVAIELPEGQLPEGQLLGHIDRADLKGHLPKVHMPSLKMPKVDFKGPKAEAGTPDLEVALPSMEMDIQTPSAKLEGDLALRDMDMSTKDSKLKMPKFKMPSFGLSASSKPSRAAVEVSVPKVQGDVDLPSVHGDLKTPEVSVQLSSAEIEAELDQVAIELPEGQLPEGELAGQSTGAGLKSHLPTVQMPSLKMPKVSLKGTQVDIKGSKLDIKGPKAEAGTPDLEVALPSMEMDSQTSSAKLEGDLVLQDKDMSTKVSKLKMPKFKMPSFGLSAPSKPSRAAVEVSVPKVQGDVDLLSVHGDLKTPEVSIQLSSAEIEAKLDQVAVELPEGQLPAGDLAAQSARADLKGQLPKAQMPILKMPKVDLKGPQVDIKGPKLDVKGSQAEVASPVLEVSLPRMEVDIEVPDSKLEGDLVLGDKDVSTKDSKFQMPMFKRPSLGVSAPGKPRAAALAVSAPTVRGSAGLTSVQGDLRTPAVLPSAKQEFEVCHVFVGLSEDHGPDISVPPSGVRISFPKFHKPKFTVRSPAVPSHHAGPQAAEPSASPPGSEPWRCPCDASLASGPHSCPGADAAQQPAGSSGVTTDEVPVEPGKSSPFKLPRFILPSFHQSPKKVPEWPGSLGSSAGDPATPVPLESDEALPPPCAQLSQDEANSGVPSDKGGEKGRTKKPGFALCRVALPKLKASKGPASAPQGDAGPALPRGPAAGHSEASGGDRARGVALGDGTKEGLSEGDGVSLQMAPDHTPSLGFAKPSLRASTAKMERKPCDADQPLPEGHSAVTVDRKPPEPGDLSASPSCVEGTVLPPEDPVQSPCRQPEASPAGRPPREAPTDAHQRRLKMPKLRLPGFRRSSSQEQGGAAGQDAAQLPLPAPDSHTPPPVLGPNVEAAVSPEPLEARLPVTAPPSPPHAALTPVQSQDHPGLQPPLPTAAVGQSDVPRSEAPTGLAAASLPPQPPRTGDSEPKAPEGEVAQRPPPGPKGPGSLIPEGPVKLTASCTDAPAQVSVVGVDRLWEDSVLTVSFPKLKVPRFSWPAPSSEAVFFPVVRDDTESGAWAAADRDQPGLWGARRLRADAEDTGEPPAPLSSEAPPISKVKVRIQGAPGQSQEVIVRSRVTREHAGVATAAGFSTQIVRESEIPASVTQVPSYGFSLLKVKGAEPCMQASIHTGALGSGAPGGLGGAPASATPGMDPWPAEPQPDATEPFEMVSASVALSGLPEEPMGTQSADHGSDEEPAEILEFPEDSWEEAATPLAGQDWAPEEKPASRKSSGLLWSWLPSIGFSSTDETGAEPRDDTPRSTPIQTQPGARTEAELPKKPEKPGWLHLPKLGFSSPTRKSKSTEARAELAEQRHQEDTTTFFDARDSFSQEEEEEERGGQGAGAAGTRQLVVREEQDRNAGEESGPVANPPNWDGIRVPSHNALEAESAERMRMRAQGHGWPQMPKVDLKGPQVDMKGSKAEAGTPDLEVALPSVEVNIQTPSAKLEGDLVLQDKDVSTKDSKLKMPKFKMPSFGVSMPSKPSEVTVEVSVPKVQGDVDLPSVHGDLKTPEVSVQQVPVKLPEGQILEGELMDQPARADLKGHLPKVHVPSLKMPKVDFKAPQLDIKGPRLDVKGPKAEADTPDLEMSLPSVEVDIQTSSGKLDGDLTLGDKDWGVAGGQLCQQYVTGAGGQPSTGSRHSVAFFWHRGHPPSRLRP
ncbi:PREDICTED: protein AHNAK2 [Dipodomys ordii]|uniref:Protein AHNAK2 n=1 Tax=Dipodomys ordii TaxID=10020 RepID=A0A1S3EUY8_DIPOR|nr:PREDICTED: protein AHNAK2 [Dipodomys ordii]